MMRASGARFHVVGTGLGVQDALDLDEPPTATGWLPIEAYPEAILQFDVGIVPLAEHPFNEAKSWLKGLEFAALGVPFVASSTGPYRELMREGVGTVALDPADWYGALSLLATDPVLREETALQGQERAARWTIEANTHRWLEAWEQAVENRSERAAA